MSSERLSDILRHNVAVHVKKMDRIIASLAPRIVERLKLDLIEISKTQSFDWCELPWLTYQNLFPEIKTFDPLSHCRLMVAIDEIMKDDGIRVVSYPISDLIKIAWDAE